MSLKKYVNDYLSYLKTLARMYKCNPHGKRTLERTTTLYEN